MTELNLPTPECRSGYPAGQLLAILQEHGRDEDEFWKWMAGQTYCLCTGLSYNYETREYEEACGGVSHGGVVYRHDVARFLHRLPVVD